MEKIYRILSALLCLAMVISFAGCNAEEEHNVYKDISLTPTADDVLTDEEYSEISETVDSIKPHYRAQDSWVTYYGHKEESERLVGVGFKGVPVLIDKLCVAVSEAGWDDDGFLYSGILALLRIDRSDVDGLADYVFTTETETEALFILYENSKRAVPEIIASDKGFDEKLEELSSFGLLALPYVLEELAVGEEKYEEFFTAIGLHMSTHEYYMECVKYTYEELKNNEVMIGEKGFIGEAENFDPEKWLEDNCVDLRIMYRALDQLTE